MTKTLTQYELEEQEFLKKYQEQVKNYPRPVGYTSDIAVFTIVLKEEKPKSKEESTREVKILLIKRKDHPSKGKWALPGGFIHPDESSYKSAKRELLEETGVDSIHIKHFGTYDEPGRDPRGWIISNAHYALVHEKHLEKRQAADDAEEVRLFTINEALKLDLAFDHLDIITEAYKMVKRELIGSTIAKEFLDKEFILSDLYDVLLSMFSIKEIGVKPNFFRKAKSFPFIKEVTDRNGEPKKVMTSKPTQLYKYIDTDSLPSIYV